MKFLILCVCLLVTVCLEVGICDSNPYTQVWYREESKSFSMNHMDGAVVAAVINFSDKINSTGWSYLTIQTNSSLPDWVQAYAAGLGEANATSYLIHLTDLNTNADFCPKPYSKLCTKLKQFLDKNLEWTVSQLNDTDDYWHQMALYLKQIKGIQDGFEKQGQTVFTEQKDNYTIESFGPVYLQQVGGDIDDLNEALKEPGERKPLDERTGPGHCSGLIKLTSDYKQLFSSQVTWTHYNTMLRVLKKYHMNFKRNVNTQEKIPGYLMTLSSYPGQLSSGDDFYVMSSGLMSLETTIGNYNEKLWEDISPLTVLEGARAVIANRLATSGEEWTSIFPDHNSGTYNNQYLIVDYKLFQPGSSLPPKGLLYAIEQLPVMTFASDITKELYEKKYFGSYNIPYFSFIFAYGGFNDLVEKYGDWWTYKEHPRAKIFARDHVKVKDMESMQKLMRYNDYTNDPLSKCNCTPPYSAENAISARSDLNPQNGTYPFRALGYNSHGGTDAKITNADLVKSQSFYAVGGPTYTDVPPFQWSKSNVNLSHYGMPDLWEFDWVLFNE